MNAVLFLLSGGGDTDVFLAPEIALKIAEEATPGDRQLTAEELIAFIPFVEDQAILEDTFDVTSGSSDNDVALHFSCALKRYDSAREAFAAAATNGWTIVDEYHGCIY